MILDAIEVGDWVLIQSYKFDTDVMPGGIPLYVMGISLPWLSVVRADQPGHIMGISTEWYHLTEVSENYVNAWMQVHAAGWKKFRDQLLQQTEEWNAKQQTGNPVTGQAESTGTQDVPTTPRRAKRRKGPRPT